MPNGFCIFCRKIYENKEFKKMEPSSHYEIIGITESHRFKTNSITEIQQTTVPIPDSPTAETEQPG